MSDTYDRYEYLKKFWSEFYGALPYEKETDEMAKKLEEKLDKSIRWELIQLVDKMNLESETISLESFIAGFRLAMGIAREVSYGMRFLEMD